MSDTGKQSPLGVNVLNSLLLAEGLTINPKFTSWVGTSRNFPGYSFGRVCYETVLRMITWSINQAYIGNMDGRMYKPTYDNIISIGGVTQNVQISSIVSGVIPSTDTYYFDVTYNNPNVIMTVGQYIRIADASPTGYNGTWYISEILSSTKFRIYSTSLYGAAVSPGYYIIDTQVPGLGNAKPMVYTWEQLIGPYGTGRFNLNDTRGWGGNQYQDNNIATCWGYIRLLALQAWMEFNYNSGLEQGTIDNPAGYRDFLQSFINAYGFIEYSNDAILSIDNSKDFLDGTYSNMNDLITADITNVSLALKDWGQDLIRLGKAIDLSSIDGFGLPSILLKTLAKYNGISKNLSLAIIAAGIPTNELGSILGNISQPTIEQERKLYAAFVLTVGDALNEILISINCKTAGLESLADLLNPKKLFPVSYTTLTVPIYSDSNTPATALSNSKISYLLYGSDGGINPLLRSPQVVDKIGSQIPPGSPLISDTDTIDNITIQEPVRGFGSYLATIIPADVALAAGAFSTSMRQIRNISEVPIEKFAQVVNVLETMAVGGSQLNTNAGTRNNVPTNLSLRTQARPLVALGSGPQGTYTASDFFGCMSGLPYNGSSGNTVLGIPESGLEGIYNKIREVQTRKLFNIYHELYLAVTWQRARTYISQYVTMENVQPFIENVPNPTYQPNPALPNYDPFLYETPTGVKTNDPYFQPRIDNWFYTVSFGINILGGGYGRGNAPVPNVDLYPNNCGGSITIDIGRNDYETPDNGDRFGRVREVSKSFGTKYLYDTTTVFQYPPPPQPTPPEEFIYIQGPPIGMLPVLPNGDINPSGVNHDPGWLAGSQGGGNPGYNAWHQIEGPIQGYINQANEEIDFLYRTKNPQCRKINDYWNSTGAQLTIEQRARQIGFRPPLADVRENFLSLWPTVMYVWTDTLPTYSKNVQPHMYAQTIENISNWNTVGGQSIVGDMRQERNQARLSSIGIELDNNIPDKLPYEQQKILITNGALPTGTLDPNIPSGSIVAGQPLPFVDIPTIPASPVIIRDDVTITPQRPGTIDIGTGEYVIINPIYGGTTPGIGTPIDTGGPIVPGSFGGSQYGNLILPNLNSWYSSSTLMPSTYTVNEAIEEVIRCNCDCWNLA